MYGFDKSFLFVVPHVPLPPPPLNLPRSMIMDLLTCENCAPRNNAAGTVLAHVRKFNCTTRSILPACVCTQHGSQRTRRRCSATIHLRNAVRHLHTGVHACDYMLNVVFAWVHGRIVSRFGCGPARQTPRVGRPRTATARPTGGTCY